MSAPRRASPLDWLAGAAGLLGGWRLLAASRSPMLRAGLAPGAIELDATARQGRGRPGTPPGALSAQAGHEVGDADTGFVARMMLVLAMAVVGAVLAMVALLAVFHRQVQAARPHYTAEQTALLDPPRPQLEAHPETDLHRQRDGERASVDGYAFVDTAHDRARIPVRRAMALLVGRSLDAAP